MTAGLLMSVSDHQDTLTRPNIERRTVSAYDPHRVVVRSRDGEATHGKRTTILLRVRP